MFRWHCPFKLPEPIVDLLQASGGTRWDPSHQPPAEPESGLLLLYPPPHAALGDPSEMLAGYQQLVDLKSQGVLVQVERLRTQPMGFWCPEMFGSSDQALETVKQADQSMPEVLEQPEPLTALVTLALLRQKPAILDAYLDFELAGRLGGSLPDSDYLGRLRLASGIKPLLNALRERDEVHGMLRVSYEEIEQLALIEHNQQDQILERDRRLVDLMQEIKQLQVRTQQFGEETSRRATDIAELQLQLEEKDRQLAMLAQERSDFEHRYSEYEQAVAVERFNQGRESDELRLQLQECQRETDTARQELTTLYGELEQLVISKQEDLREIDRLGNVLENLREQLRESGERNSQLCIANERALAQLEELQVERSRERSLLEKQCHDLGETLSQANEQLRIKEQEIETSHQESSRLLHELQAERSRERSMLERQCHELGEIVRQANEQLRAKEQEINSLNQESIRILDELQGERARERSVLEKQCHDLGETLLQVNEQLRAKEQEIDTSHQESSRLLEELQRIEEELEHYYRSSLHSQNLVEAQQRQLQRSVNLLRRMTVVKQLPAVGSVPAPIQLLALLEGYRHSLKRAERLLRGGGDSRGGKLSL
jgi:DNA repair exonuclease SbcCD ATPase subunit